MKLHIYQFEHLGRRWHAVCSGRRRVAEAVFPTEYEALTYCLDQGFPVLVWHASRPRVRYIAVSAFDRPMMVRAFSNEFCTTD